MKKGEKGDAFFDETTLRKLTRLTLVASQIRAGMLKGDRRSTRRGASLEFADYRNYTPGDDLRRLDWNVYARLDRPFMKLFEEEEDLAVHLLLDASRSMDWGEGENNKYRYALRLAAALGAIALAAGDRLTAATLQHGDLASEFGPSRGRQNTLPWLEFLKSRAPAGSTQLNRSLRAYSLGSRRPGLVFLISDLFDPDGFHTGIGQLQSRGHEVVLIHVLAPDELDPPLAGDLRLVDVETGQSQEVSLDGGLRDLYRQKLQDWRGEIQAACRKRKIHYLDLSTAQPWDQVVLQEMRVEGIVK